VLAASRERITAQLAEDAVVLDVGGWASPISRANWVVDLLPHATRGLYGDPDPEPERFDESTWAQFDICAAEPWPFADDQFDFAICSHTLEDVRDPIRVCAELSRVARAGYIETPSRLQEQAYGVVGDFVGWSHHRWLVSERDGGAHRHRAGGRAVLGGRAARGRANLHRATGARRLPRGGGQRGGAGTSSPCSRAYAIAAPIRSTVDGWVEKTALTSPGGSGSDTFVRASCT
jgi:hypothetical protein